MKKFPTATFPGLIRISYLDSSSDILGTLYLNVIFLAFFFFIESRFFVVPRYDAIFSVFHYFLDFVSRSRLLLDLTGGYC